MKTMFKSITEFLETPIEEMMYEHYLGKKDHKIIAKKYALVKKLKEQK
tara:strand:- start:251 stop:394 length:144 start_codon:yes stop_codon:yes gene_type:complete